MIGTKENSTDLLLTRMQLQMSGHIDVVPVPDDTLLVAVHTLWSLSLILILGSALGAIMVRQWSHEYLRYSRFHTQPSTRARIRARLFNGVHKYRMEQVIALLPQFLHLAIMLFCAGLVTYFFTFSKVIAYSSLALFSIIVASYLCFTILPLVDLSSPFKTPLTTFLWRTAVLLRLVFLCTLHWVTSLVSLESPYFVFRLPKIIKACRERYRGGLAGALEQDLESVHPNLDAHALRWAILSLGDDDAALESFIGGIPDLLASDPQSYPQFTIGNLLEDREVRLGWTIGRLLETCTGHAATSTLAPHVRARRAHACLGAVWSITEKFAGTDSLYWDTLFGAHTADALASLAHANDASVALVARASAALAARSCIRELAHVAHWTQAKGPYWASRAPQLAALVVRLGALPLPLPHDAPEDLARDGALLVLASFLAAAVSPPADAADRRMVGTTVAHLAEGVRAQDASQEAQRTFVRLALSGDACAPAVGDPRAERALRCVVDGLRHRETRVRSSFDSSCTAFEGVDASIGALARRCMGDSPLGIPPAAVG